MNDDLGTRFVYENQLSPSRFLARYLSTGRSPRHMIERVSSIDLAPDLLCE